MKGDWGICLEIRIVYRRGHDVKWPLLIAEMMVELTERRLTP